jgi:Kef-type K+ transport system membrane component KefB
MHLFTEFSLVIGVATLVALLMRLLRQPLIIGHILTGLIVGPFFLGFIGSPEILSFFSEIGIAILLFTVGLSINPKAMREFGKVALFTGLGQIIFTSIIGYLISIALGFDPLSAFYIAITLTFSSTIIIMKLVTDKGDLEKLYAKIAVGFLLVQDLVAIMLLFTVPLVAAGGGSWTRIPIILGSGIALVIATLYASSQIFPKLNNYFAKSEEFLFLFSLAWGMGMATLFKHFGFSLESGALIAGIALSSLNTKYEINARLNPLRDFFIVLFFVSLGSQMLLDGLASTIGAAIVLSAFVLLGKAVILMAITGYLGYRKKTSLQTGFTVAQVSEFSLIFMAMGLKLGHISPETLSLVTLVALITIFGSSYFILYSDRIYDLLGKYLNVFERKNIHEQKLNPKIFNYFLFGSGRIGYDFLSALKDEKDDFLIIDHDPDTIRRLELEGFNTLYGDSADLELLESLDFSKAKMMVSTIPELKTNLLIAHAAQKQSSDYDAIVMIAVSHNIEDSLKLYDEHYDYVIMPHFIGGNFAAELVQRLQKDKKQFSSIKEKHVDYLLNKKRIGHEHPHYKI